MSLQSQKIKKIGRAVLKIRQREENAVSKTELFFLRLGRWATMLAHELFKDEVKIRAESLSFLMVFSLLPLIAGGFFLFNIFAKFGFVQDALRGAIDNLLLSIPYEHREIVSQYVTQFANTYWDSVSSKSGSIGIFALFILLWVGLSTFNNIDRTLNHIWSSHRERPFFEKFRNFLVTMVLAPIVLVSALSIPLILLKMDIGAFVVEKFPLIPFLVNALLFPLLGWLTFTPYLQVHSGKRCALEIGILWSHVLHGVPANRELRDAAVLPIRHQQRLRQSRGGTADSFLDLSHVARAHSGGRSELPHANRRGSIRRPGCRALDS